MDKARKKGSKSCLNELSKWAEWAEILWGFTKILNQTDPENSSCLSWQTKEFYP